MDKKTINKKEPVNKNWKKIQIQIPFLNGSGYKKGNFFAVYSFDEWLNEYHLSVSQASGKKINNQQIKSILKDFNAIHFEEYEKEGSTTRFFFLKANKTS